MFTYICNACRLEWQDDEREVYSGFVCPDCGSSDIYKVEDEEEEDDKEAN